MSQFLGVTVDLDDVDGLKEAEGPEVAQRFNVAGGSGVTECLYVADVLGVTIVSSSMAV